MKLRLPIEYERLTKIVNVSHTRMRFCLKVIADIEEQEKEKSKKEEEKKRAG
jgi:hypothetical protein